MRINLYLLTVVLLFLTACWEEKHRIIVDKDFNYTIANHPWAKYSTWPNESFGLNDIIRNEFSDDSLLHSDTSFLCFNSYISNDTVILFYENPNSFLTIYIHDSTYEIKLEYLTDIANQYKISGEPTGHFAAKIKSQKLLLKDLSLKLNDTIVGYMEIETKPFLRLERGEDNSYYFQYDEFIGSFTSVITDIKMKEPYIIP